jgi:hypothetical protein
MHLKRLGPGALSTASESGTKRGQGVGTGQELLPNLAGSLTPALAGRPPKSAALVSVPPPFCPGLGDQGQAEPDPPGRKSAPQRCRHCRHCRHGVWSFQASVITALQIAGLTDSRIPVLLYFCLSVPTRLRPHGKSLAPGPGPTGPARWVLAASLPTSVPAV